MRLRTECRLISFLILVASAAVHSEEVCSLTDDQTKNLTQTFSQITAVFTQEPRCVNCHGGMDIFASNTKHGGGQQDKKGDFSATFAQCQDCHISPNGYWRLPPPMDLT